MADPNSVQVDWAKIFKESEQIKDLHELTEKNKLTGKEMLLIETNDGSQSYKIKVDTFLGYIATTIENIMNGKQLPTWEDKQIVVIPNGEDIPIDEREDNDFYLKVCDENEAQLLTSESNTYIVSPNMGLKVYR